jgi:hypothetical protein
MQVNQWRSPAATACHVRPHTRDRITDDANCRAQFLGRAAEPRGPVADLELASRIDAIASGHAAGAHDAIGADSIRHDFYFRLDALKRSAASRVPMPAKDEKIVSVVLPAR